jgi:hypothetical protein
MRGLAGSRRGSPPPDLAGGPRSALRIRGKGAAWAASALAALAAVAVGALAGCWFLPFLLGVVVGWTARYGRLRRVLVASICVAVAGWAVPLLWLAGRGVPVAATASTIAVVAGLPASAALIVAATLLVAAIQVTAGLWVARAAGRWRRST